MVKKRWIVALFLLWTLAMGQLVQGHMQEEERVAEVFAQVGETEQTGVVEYYGIYGKGFLDPSGQETFLREIAAGLGITDHIRVTRSTEEGREEVRLTKSGSNADTLLRMITSPVRNEKKQYMIMKITMKGDMENTYAYRQKLEELADPYAENRRSSANIIGSYEGKLSLKERDAITDRLLEELDAEIVWENREMQLYTIYGYTPWISECEMQEEEAVNVNIVMYYSKSEDRTYVYAAVPVVGLDY